MKYLIIGAKGSMGQRYRAILKSLCHDFNCTDFNHDEDVVLNLARLSDGIIIASPTDTHLYYINLLAPLSKPILCEKPVCKNIDDVRDAIEICQANKTPLTMMMQYKVLTKAGDVGESYYDYFRTGPDGLPWDCFQVLALAENKVKVNNESPTWECMINGRKLSLADMDKAYVRYVKAWIRGYKQSSKEILGMHQKVRSYGKK